MEQGDEIYSLCQVPVVIKTEVPDKSSSPSPPPSSSPVVKKLSSTEKFIKPKCLVDSTTFLLPAGNGPVYLHEVKNNKCAKAPEATVTATTTATSSTFKKKPIVCSESPKATTAKIFAPRTEDMNKGFLTFSDDDTGLTSKPTFPYFLSV